MVSKIVGWVILVPLCLGLIVFALANRHFVAINFNPFAASDAAVAPGYGVPLFVVLYVVLLIGVLLGGTATWFAQSHHRRREKHWRREAHALNGELEKLRRTQGQAAQGALTEVDDLLELR
ncbi:lipopolysaccharide assembly protein LapA domain-containing protein [Devosia sp. A449]